MSAVDWLVSQPWPVFLAIWIPSLLVFGGVLLALFARPRRLRKRKVSNWDMHECGCLCAGGLIYPCDGHRGHAAAALHQEAP